MTLKLDRRHLLAGGLAVAGAGLFRVGHAFPRDASRDFSQATKILKPYGITIAGDSATGHDQLRTDVVPLANTEYSHTVFTDTRTVEPCVRTSFFANDATFTHFHPTGAGGVEPCIRTTIFGHALAVHEILDHGSPDPSFLLTTEMQTGGHIGAVDFTHFHDGALIPCIKTAIPDDTIATHEIYDGDLIPCVRVESQMLPDGHTGDIVLTHFHDGAVDPCWRTSILGHAAAVAELFTDGKQEPSVVLQSEMLDGGVLGHVQMTINDGNASLSITVGTHTYRLVNGELVEA